MESEKKDRTKEKEAETMPTVELIEYERITYIKEMEEYLHKLKKMPKDDAIKKSRENLINSNIILENGDFAEQYRRRN